MRRETLVLAVIAAALSTGCPSAPPEAAKGTEPSPRAGFTDVRGDAVSGCPDGSALVKVVITLTPGGGRGCRAEVSPDRVCVGQGGAILWKVSSSCDALPGTNEAPALRVTPPVLRAAAAKAAPGGAPAAAAAASILAHCEPQLDTVAPGDTRFFCGIRDDAVLGLYKYGLGGGGIDELDPDIEVRKGR